jgi:hypothetical protein
MNGDFSRLTFDRKKHYSSVRWQQGRVQLDADFNEQVDIATHRVETGTADLIGLSGAPFRGETTPVNFQIFVDTVSKILKAAPGHIYVDGLLCENDGSDGEASVFGQTDLPMSPPAVIARDDTTVGESAIEVNTTYLVYLDAWQRHLTALDDDSLLETALGGPDTTTRTKTVWQVKLLPFAGADARCGETLWETTAGRSSGGLTAKFERETSSVGPCDPPTADVARRGENQLYRIEVHKKGGLDEATFKWSRDNGTVVATIDITNCTTPGKLPLKTNGRDDAHRFARDNWAELTDDTHELRGLPGLFVHITGVDGSPAQLTIDPPNDDDGQLVALDQLPALFANNPKLRRWDTLNDDGGKQVGTRTLRRNAADNEYLPIENGLKVLFGKVSEPPPAAADPRFQTGDYWLIPIRTQNPELRWPSDTPDHPLSVKPHGVDHHFCPLAFITTDAASKFGDPSDCRPLFPAVTDLANLHYVGGDGQTAAPNDPLPLPLEVGVFNGRWPVLKAEVRFTVLPLADGTVPAGKIAGSLRDLDNQDTTGIFKATTGDRDDQAGIATVFWRPDPDPKFAHQQVEASLLDALGNEVGLPVRFGGTILRPVEGSAPAAVQSVLFRPKPEQEAVPFRDGTIMSPEMLDRGLWIEFDQGLEIDPATINEATCHVNMELPVDLNGGKPSEVFFTPAEGSDFPFFDQAFMLPVVVRAFVVHLDGEAGDTPKSALWLPTGTPLHQIGPAQGVSSALAGADAVYPILARLKVDGLAPKSTGADRETRFEAFTRWFRVGHFERFEFAGSVLKPGTATEFTASLFDGLEDHEGDLPISFVSLNQDAIVNRDETIPKDKRVGQFQIFASGQVTTETNVVVGVSAAHSSGWKEFRIFRLTVRP